MGSPANIFVEHESDPRKGVYIYTHWDGYNMARWLRYALMVSYGRGANDSRWDDAPYLTANIFRVLTCTDSFLDITGKGISPEMTDNQYNILRVVPDRQVVEIVSEDTGDVLDSCSMAQFVSMSDDEVYRFHHQEDSTQPCNLQIPDSLAALVASFKL